MSKRLIVLAFLLFTTGLCEASLKLMVDGEIVGDDYIFGVPSDTFTIGIISEQDIIGFALRIEVDKDGCLDSSGIVFPEDWDMPPCVIDSSEKYVDIIGADFPWNLKEGPVVICDGILFHLEGYCADISLYAIGDTIMDEILYPAGTFFDSVQILFPEPMTLAMLGLGGLFLRRRK